jgi:hypothetical protein
MLTFDNRNDSGIQVHNQLAQRVAFGHFCGMVVIIRTEATT